MRKNKIYNGIKNISIIHDHLENIIETTSASVYWKDKKGVYLGVNDEFIRVSAMQSYDEVVGATDLDLMWNEQAALIMKNDQKTIYSQHANTYRAYKIAE